MRRLATQARPALALAVLLAMIWSAGCGRKAMPEPRQSASDKDEGRSGGVPRSGVWSAAETG
ncbi:MAG TPA: hypothetical protein PK416_03845, partial [Thermodesulfobacteriota bacterium]|nr:hypothetical protein [Thermodesulfobacteriota bacterium]